MEKSDKPLTREALISMQVIDAKGRAIGKVKDITFTVGKTTFSLLVENENGETQNIAWENIQAALDFIILKPVEKSTSLMPEVQSQAATKPMPDVQSQASTKPKGRPLCPTCQRQLTWIPQYKRWYCYHDKKYV